MFICYNITQGDKYLFYHFTYKHDNIIHIKITQRKPVSMKSPIQFNNLRNLIPTQKSRIKLAEETGISFYQINNWLDPNNESVPTMDIMIILAKYFGCSIDFLLDLADKQG